ncbi:peptide chain release factor N(5)-glutamine methyltransferase [Winogradskyella sp. 3972H.M.0a.05]|uniref:peptide chain release factor N(5)-glutamine methyltransferase n=1 Tax=Winogradskyella sp. 3972H.M.0a.05 TaxID=2950277 RepID=UPI0033936C60
MRLKDVKEIFRKELKGIYAEEEIDNFFFMGVESFYDIDRLRLALNPEISIAKAEQEPILEALHNLKQQKPIQYILGETEFYGLPFKVNSHVLIPRPETEELVDWILNDTSLFSDGETLRILDIGTGSGCIIVSLAKHLSNSKTFALDVSKEALRIATENASNNNVAADFMEVNILEEGNWDLIFEDMEFDIIVSNPPYVLQSEKELMKPNVLENEPHLALFVENDDPLLFYKVISRFADRYLSNKGCLYFEINEVLGNDTRALLEADGFKNIEVRKDIFNKDRMVKAIKA